MISYIYGSWMDFLTMPSSVLCTVRTVHQKCTWKEMLLGKTILFYGSESNSLPPVVMNIDMFTQCSLHSLKVWGVELNPYLVIIMTYFPDGWFKVEIFFTTSYSVQCPQCLAHMRRSKIISCRSEWISLSPFSLTQKQRIKCNHTMFGGQWVKRNFVCYFAISIDWVI